MNKHIGIGNLTRDVEVFHTEAGLAIAKTGFAMNRRYVSKTTGEPQGDTCFIDITIFGETGKTFAKYFKKGDAVGIEGRLDYSTWEDKNGRGKRSKISIIVEKWEFLPSRVSSETTADDTEVKF